MKNFFFFLIFLCSYSSIHSQTWDGEAMDNNWNNPINWNTNMVPLLGATVQFTQTVTVTSTGAVAPPVRVIVSGNGTILTLDLDLIIGDGATALNALVIRANTQVIIPAGRTLVVNAPPNNQGIVNGSSEGNAAMTVHAGGSIDIVSGARAINIMNNTFVFTNNGTIGITTPNTDAVFLVQGATFNNNETLAILGGGEDGIDNSGEFNNTGSITIISSNNNCILNRIGATFNNSGDIDISDILNTSFDGIRSEGTFNNQLTGLINVGNMTDDAVDARNGTFTNTGEMYLTVKNTATPANVGLAIGTTTMTSNFINNGIIDIDGGISVTGRAVFVYPDAADATTLTNNGLITVRNGNPNNLFFNRGITINGPTGTINTGNVRINVNLGNFTNNGLI